MTTNNEKKQNNSTLGALACLVLFLILTSLKFSPSAPFPDMPILVMTAPIWLPIFVLFIYVVMYCIMIVLESMMDNEDENNNFFRN